MMQLAMNNSSDLVTDIWGLTSPAGPVILAGNINRAN